MAASVISGLPLEPRSDDEYREYSVGLYLFGALSMFNRIACRLISALSLICSTTGGHEARPSRGFARDLEPEVEDIQIVADPVAAIEHVLP